MLRNLAGAKPKQWDQSLIQAEFAFNSVANISTKLAPFISVYSSLLQHPMDLFSKIDSLSQTDEFYDQLQEN